MATVQLEGQAPEHTITGDELPLVASCGDGIPVLRLGHLGKFFLSRADEVLTVCWAMH